EASAIFLREELELQVIAQAANGMGTEYDFSQIASSVQMRAVMNKGRSEILVDRGVIVPLPSRGRIAGAIVVIAKTLSSEEIHLLEEIGRRAGIALENARLYAETQAANRLKDEFVAALSHELRTPLTPILGAIYMLRSEPTDKRIFAKALDLIERNAKA